MQYICPVEDALLHLERHDASNNVERWTPKEMRELKTACTSWDFGDDLVQAMKAAFNNWTVSAGRADINQVESWMRQYYGE